MLPLHAHLDVSTGAKGLSFGLNLHLLPYLKPASSEGSCEHVHLTFIYTCHELLFKITSVSSGIWLYTPQLDL